MEFGFKPSGVDGFGGSGLLHFLRRKLPRSDPESAMNTQCKNTYQERISLDFP